MKKKLIFFSIVIFFLSVIRLYSANLVVHLKDNSRILSKDFTLPLDNNEKRDVYNPNVRVTDLNISQMEYTSDKDNLVHFILKDDLLTKVSEIDFVDRVPGISDNYSLKIKFLDKTEENTSNARFYKYSGNNTPSKKISVLRFDDYNNTWVPEYIDISMIDKIEFRKRALVKKEDSIKKDESETESKDKKESGYKKKVLFSSDNFQEQSFAQNLKDAMLSLKNSNNEFGTSIVLRVNFDFDSSAINSKAASFLDIISGVLNSPELAGARFSLRGFTDNTGDEKYNLTLSKKRAESVRAYLQKKNISSLRIESKGFGEAMPILPNTSEYYKSLNRRVEIYPLYF
ncbi:MAG: OmpA family protein [Desulfobacteraceae bacterium]|nr:OmpA family protein [Desulfobacteraceae bacterium]MCB9495128.1 OmpA family protein [Desulfobacteraceae bacterium]